MTADADRYPPIEDHGVIGDLQTVALVCLDGTIDFLCLPSFDSPTVFASLLDAERGGSFRIAPEIPAARRTQIYLPDTNVLLTRFLAERGILELTDFMPVAEAERPTRIVRIVKAVRGETVVRMRCRPAFDYGRCACRFSLSDAGRRAACSASACPADCSCRVVTLSATVPMEATDEGVVATFTLCDGEMAVFVLDGDGDMAAPVTVEAALESQKETERFWRHWLATSSYRGRWREMVCRSALILKLLVSRRTGSMVAAPTFGLPEEIGGPRNWDYRFCWIRDSAFTIYALIRLGFVREAEAYTSWITERAEASPDQGTLRLMYRLDGSEELEERSLDHFEGYMGSRPVRIGNAAATQLQLDMYGEFIDAVFLTNKYANKVPSHTWTAIRRCVDYVAANWEQPDEGIWEFRGGRRHFLHSRLMCWVAMDRAIRIAEMEGFPAPVPSWRRTRDAIYEDIFESFWDEEMQSFVQHKGAKHVDAALLLMPLVKFISGVDPRWLSTLDRIGRDLASDVLVHRYDSSAQVLDTFGDSKEGGFTMCSFWYVECLARAGRVQEARLLFEKMASYANHLGLYSEELGLDGRQLGNFPQAFTHLALISAAHALEFALERGR